MEEEEDAEMQEAIRRSMNDYNAMHAAAAAACTSWSPGTAAASSSPSLHHHPVQPSIHVPLQQQQYPYRPQTQVPLPLQQQQLHLQLRTPSSSSLEGAGMALRTGRGLWEGSSSPLSAAASPLRSTPSPSAAAAVSSAACPFPLRASAAAGSARAGGLESSSVAAFRENKTGATAGPAAGPGGLSAAGRFAAVHTATAGQAGGANNWPTERTPSSMNWLCDAEELFHPRQQQQQQRLPVLQHQQQHHHHHCPQHQQQQHSPSRAPATSLPLSSCFSLRQQQQHQQSPAQLRQLQVSEQPYLQLARQQQHFLLDEQLQQHQGQEDERYASIVTGGSEEDENVALQKAIQESLLTCPSAFRSSQQLTSPQDTAAAAKDNAKTSRGGEAAAGGTPARGEGVVWTRRDEEEEEQQQQYELHSPSSSRLLSLPAGAVSAARGYPEDISEFLLPPPQHQEVRERQTQRQKRSTLQPPGLQQQGQPMQLRRQQEEQEELHHAAAAGGTEPLRSQKAPTDRCKTPVSWIGEEEAEEAARENLYFSSSSFSSPAAVAGGSRLCAPQPTAFSAAADVPGGAAGLDRGERTSAADDESSAGASQEEPFSGIRTSAEEGSSSGSSSNNGDSSSLSRSRVRRKHDEEMRRLLLQKMQPLPAEPDLKELLDIVFGEEGMNREIDPSDLSRWFHHPFLFAGDVPAPSLSPVQKAAEDEDAECEWLVNSSTQWREKASCCLWGLVQLHGGPCGLLAAVQCFLLRALLFSPGRVTRYARLLGLQRRQQQQQQQHPEQPQQQRVGVGAAAEGEKEGDARPQEGQRIACPSSMRDCHSCSGDSSSTNTSGGNGECGGKRNVELSSLLPSPLTRRHALVEALAAVLYQCTPVSLYTVAYVLPANVQQLQQPPAPAAEDGALLPQADTCSNSHLRRRSSSRTRSATAGAASTADTEAGEQEEAAAAARQMGEETEAAGRNSGERERGSGGGGRQRGKRKEDEVESVSEMLEDVRVYVRRFTHIEDVMHFYNQFYDVLLAGETGVIAFLFSVLLTRGIQQVANDMDMPGHSLIGVYGHCSQDLVNLLLLGAASSNVFDGDRKLGSFTAASAAPVPAAAPQSNEEGGTAAASARGGRSAGESATAAATRGQAEAAATDAGRETPAEKRKNADDKEEEEEQTHLKGVRKRPLAGFLSEMEALRYCEVGSRYKHPHFPLWVVGSSNHYTTLFSRDLLAAAVPTARLAEIEAQAAFRDFDRDGNFLILTEHLAALLAQLGQQERLLEAQRATSAAEGVVLLSDFLRWYSQVVAQQRSQSGEDVEPPQKFTVYIYDGQTPPGPSLRRFLVEARSSDSNSSSNNGEAEAEEMRRLLSTRWPGAAVSELPLLPLHLSSHA